MTKHARHPFFALLKVALLGVSVPLVVTSQSWVQASTKQDNTLEYAQAPAKSTPQPNSSAEAKQTTQPTQEEKQEESKKSDQQQEPSLIVTAAILGVAVVLYLGVLWRKPLALLLLPDELAIPKTPIKLPPGVLAFLKYQPRVLDAWVVEGIQKVKEEFEGRDTVKDRKIYIDIPVKLDSKLLAQNLTPKDLQDTFIKKKEIRLLILGEGGRAIYDKHLLK